VTPEIRAVPAADLRNSPFRTPLSPDLVERVIALRAALAGAYDMTEEQWLEGFERDASPAREIEWWEKLAAAFHAFAEHYLLDPALRPAAFTLALGTAMGWSGKAIAEALDQLPSGSLDTMNQCLCDQWD
jgi:hypothetical protein